MPRITARQHRSHVRVTLASIEESHRLINQRLDGLANQVAGLATAARVAAVLDQLAALGTHASEDHDDTLAQLATIGTQVDTMVRAMSEWIAAVQAAAPAEAPAPAAQPAPAAAKTPRRRAAGAK